ncbi:MAG: rod shape-determining protein MreC [Anaerolineae bacterium]|nr:rod shape-determining protein MreC [Anaerolineales bacterium]MCQ3979463.1 rod shape-determining protein MreC [Anaerolineae bacterium]
MTAAKNRPLFIGLILALLFLGFALDRLGYMTRVRTFAQTALAPLQEVTTGVAQNVSGRLEQSQSLQLLQARNAELEALNNKLMVDNVRLRELERENELLRQLLNYTRSNLQFSYQTTTVIGRSIGVDPTNLLYFVYVNVGARDGIAENMPVITDRGLVGRVTAVGPNLAQVLMLIDPASAVNALIQNSRVTGLVRGNIDGTLIMERIPQDAKVNPGDIVLTSGLGGNFPDKLVIGQVTEVVKRDQDMFQTARIRPTVDFGKLETMLIITSFQPIDFEAEILRAQEAEN